MVLRFEYPVDGLDLLEEFVTEFVRDIDKAEHKIRVFAGECNASLYSHMDLIEAFRRAKKNGITVIIIAGPILSALVRDGKKYSGLLDLVREGVVLLYRRNRRERKDHYRIIDNDFVRVETFHESLEGLHLRKPSNNDNVDELLKEFDNYLIQQDVVPSTDPWRDFLILSPNEVETMRNHCAYLFPRRTMSDLDRDEILKVYRKISDVWDKEFKNLPTSYGRMKSYLDKTLSKS